MRRRQVAKGGWLLGAMLLVGCGSEASKSSSSGPPEGYVRYTTNPLVVAPGYSAQWFEWVAPPVDHDLNVVDIIGTQSRSGTTRRSTLCRATSPSARSSRGTWASN